MAPSHKIEGVMTEELTRADNGKFVRLRAGETLSICLPENPTTGSRWQVEQSDVEVLVPADSTYEARGTGVGSGGLRRLSFRGVSPGKGNLLLSQHRPWRKKNPADPTFSLEIEVVP